MSKHIHKSDGSTANPSKLVCKICGETYSYDTNVANSLKPNSPQPNQDTTVDDVEQIFNQLDNDFHDYYDGRWNYNEPKPLEKAKASIQAHYARKQVEQLQQIANANYDDMHQTYDYDGIAETVLDILNKEVRV